MPEGTRDVQAARQLPASAAPWPDPPTPATAQKVAWPDPPPLPVGGDISGQDTRREKVLVTAAHPGEDARSDVRAVKQLASTIGGQGSRSEMPLVVLLAFGVGLTIFGMLGVRIARMRSARQRTIDRRNLDWTDSLADEPEVPEIAARPSDLVFGRIESSREEDKVERTRRLLAQVLGQEAA